MKTVHGKSSPTNLHADGIIYHSRKEKSSIVREKIEKRSESIRSLAFA